MQDIKTSDVIAYLLDCLGYPNLAEDAKKGDSVIIDMYSNFIKHKISNIDELRQICDFYL